MSADTPSPGARLARELAIFTGARIALVVVIAAVIIGVGHLASVAVPMLVAAIFAVLIAMPLSMFVFKGMRARVNEAIALVDARRRSDKESLRAQLRGDA